MNLTIINAYSIWRFSTHLINRRFYFIQGRVQANPRTINRPPACKQNDNKILQIISIWDKCLHYIYHNRNEFQRTSFFRQYYSTNLFHNLKNTNGNLLYSSNRSIYDHRYWLEFKLQANKMNKPMSFFWAAYWNDFIVWIQYLYEIVGSVTPSIES